MAAGDTGSAHAKVLPDLRKGNTKISVKRYRWAEIWLSFPTQHLACPLGSTAGTPGQVGRGCRSRLGSVPQPPRLSAGLGASALPCWCSTSVMLLYRSLAVQRPAFHGESAELGAGARPHVSATATASP